MNALYENVAAHLVDVFASEKSEAPPRLFVALVARAGAVAAVQHCLPHGWTAVLSRQALNSDEVSAMRLQYGHVREIAVR